MMKPSERVFNEVGRDLTPETVRLIKSLDSKVNYVAMPMSDRDGDYSALQEENEMLKSRIADLEETLSYFQDAESEGQPDSEG